MCGVSSEAEAAAKVPRGYALRGALPIRRLDAVLPRDTEVQVGRGREGHRPARLFGSQIFDNSTLKDGRGEQEGHRPTRRSRNERPLCKEGWGLGGAGSEGRGVEPGAT